MRDLTVMQLRAIVIDDDESCRLLLAQVLEQRGYEVICLPDPAACPLFNNSVCSCPEDAACGCFLLTANQMPGMTGLEFSARQMQGEQGERGQQGSAFRHLEPGGIVPDSAAWL